jgi:hypothetical protein
MAFRDVEFLVTEASRAASAEDPRSLTFRPVHDGPAEIAAPLKHLADTNPEVVKDTSGKSVLEVAELPAGVEILPTGGFDITEGGTRSKGYVQPMFSSSRVPAPLIR